MPHTGRLISGLEMEPMKALVTSPLYLLCPARFMSAPVLDHSNGPLPSYVLEVGVRVDVGHPPLYALTVWSPFLQSICDLLCLTVVVLWTTSDIWHFLCSASEEQGQEGGERNRTQRKAPPCP